MERHATEATIPPKFVYMGEKLTNSTLWERRGKYQSNDRLIRTRDTSEPTKLMVIYSHDDFMDAIGGMEVLELIRFEKQHLMVLLEISRIDTQQISRMTGMLTS